MALYLVESFKEANLFRKLALIFLLIALFIGWVAYCTGSWGRSFPTADNDFYIGYGVWRVAANNGDNSNPTSNSGNNAPIPSSYSYTDGWLLSESLERERGWEVGGGVRENERERGRGGERECGREGGRERERERESGWGREKAGIGNGRRMRVTERDREWARGGGGGGGVCKFMSCCLSS